MRCRRCKPRRKRPLSLCQNPCARSFIRGLAAPSKVARSGGVRGMPLSRRNTWKAALSVPLPGLWQCKRACAAKVCVAVVSRSVFLSGQAAKKNYEHPYAPSRSPLHHGTSYDQNIEGTPDNPVYLSELHSVPSMGHQGVQIVSIV